MVSETFQNCMESIGLWCDWLMVWLCGGGGVIWQWCGCVMTMV